MALTALVDPTRRQIFEILRFGPKSVGEIARELPVSRPAVSQHLKVLKEARLVRETQHGTKHIYRLDLQGLEGLRKYLESFWDDVLSAFKEAAESNQGGYDETED